MRTYLISLNGCPWFLLTLPAWMSVHQVARGVAVGAPLPEGVTGPWVITTALSGQHRVPGSLSSSLARGAGPAPARPARLSGGMR